jgi:hypothetical protein
LLLAVLVFWAFRSGRLVVPPEWHPWAPLDVRAAPNLLTSFKLQRASAEPGACLLALSTSDLRVVTLEDRSTGPGCGFDNAVRIERAGVAVGKPFNLSCRAALSLALWDRHVLQQAAQRHLGANVQLIEHLGSYACRNLYGKEGRRRSQHATADAWDIAGFVLSDGRRISVLRDWSRRDDKLGADAIGSPRTPSPEALFLREVRDGACRWFDAVLGPDYNAAHADHFHFDRGRAQICR